MPQVHEPGQEAEVDWGEAVVEIAGQRRKVYLFLMRACYSGAAFVMAFERETQQAFLEAHVEAFRFFGGCFQLVRYDNLRAAVKQVLRGRRRKEQDASSPRAPTTCTSRRSPVAARRGLTRMAGSRARSGASGAATSSPSPRSARSPSSTHGSRTPAELGRRIADREETVGEALRAESRALRELPLEDYETSEQASPRVDSKALVTVRQNRYSVPVALVGLRRGEDRGARDRHQPRRPRGRPPPAPVPASA